MATKKAALGRGLDALIPSNASSAPDDAADLSSSKIYDFEDRLRLVGRVAEIEVDKITSNPFQPRDAFDQPGLEELAASITQLGIIQPVTVRSLGGGRFELIAGERRVRAARMAGLDRVPAYVRQADTESMLEMAIVENIQREELNPIEVALGYQRLIEEVQLTQERVADKVGKSRAAVTNMLRLLKLPPFIQALLKTGTLTIGHARALVNVDDSAAQKRIVEETVREGLSVRDVEKKVRALSERPAVHRKKREVVTPDAENQDPHVAALADQIRSRLSTNVQIRHKETGAGRIEIAYYSPEDLERLVELLLS